MPWGNMQKRKFQPLIISQTRSQIGMAPGLFQNPYFESFSKGEEGIILPLHMASDDH